MNSILGAAREIKDDIGRRFFAFEWFELYDFIGFTSRHFKDSEFDKHINAELDHEKSAYRVLEHVLTPITDEIELDAIETALDSTDKLDEPAGKHLKAQQNMFNQFRNEYNDVRPHEAMATPGSVHIHSPRTYNRRITEWEYDRGYRTRYVTVNGSIRWKSDVQVMVSTALGGRYIGMDELDDGVWAV